MKLLDYLKQFPDYYVHIDIWRIMPDDNGNLCFLHDSSNSFYAANFSDYDFLSDLIISRRYCSK